MRTFTSAIQIARHVLANELAWFFFVEIPRRSGGSFRLVNNNRHVTADGKFWQAASFDIELPAEDAGGSLGEATFVLQDVSRLAIALIEIDGELVGQTAVFAVQHESNLGTFDPALEWSMVIKAVEVSERTVKAECGHPAMVARVPSRVFSRAQFPQLLATGAG